MNDTRKRSPVQDAYARCKPARDLLIELDGQCMETTEDKAGILWERWILQKDPLVADSDGSFRQHLINVILFATPHWWDVFTPVTETKEIDRTLEAIRALTK